MLPLMFLYLLPFFNPNVDVSRTLKIIQAIPNMPKPVTETEVNDFLESKLNIQIAPLMKKDIQ
jgi:hypothetical protein